MIPGMPTAMRRKQPLYKYQHASGRAAQQAALRTHPPCLLGTVPALSSPLALAGPSGRGHPTAPRHTAQQADGWVPPGRRGPRLGSRPSRGAVRAGPQVHSTGKEAADAAGRWAQRSKRTLAKPARHMRMKAGTLSRQGWPPKYLGAQGCLIQLFQLLAQLLHCRRLQGRRAVASQRGTPRSLRGGAGEPGWRAGLESRAASKQ